MIVSGIQCYLTRKKQLNWGAFNNYVTLGGRRVLLRTFVTERDDKEVGYLSNNVTVEKNCGCFFMKKNTLSIILLSNLFVKVVFLEGGSFSQIVTSR